MRSITVGSILLCLSLFIQSCKAEPNPERSAPTEIITAPASEIQTSQPTGDIEGAKAAIKAEKAVIDFIHQPDETFQWVIGVKDDGSSRFGYAEYICSILKDHGVPIEQTLVRIVDYQRFVLDGNGRAASLGSVACKTGEHISP